MEARSHSDHTAAIVAAHTLVDRSSGSLVAARYCCSSLRIRLGWPWLLIASTGCKSPRKVIEAKERGITLKDEVGRDELDRRSRPFHVLVCLELGVARVAKERTVRRS